MRKLRPILDLIRGKYADDALDMMKYLPHRGARMIEEVLKSAMANAEDQGVRNVGDLSSPTPEATAARCSSGSCRAPAAWPTWSAAGRCHISIGLADLEPARSPAPVAFDGDATPRTTTTNDFRRVFAPSRLALEGLQRHGPERSTNRLPDRYLRGLAEPLVREQA